jgi:hypothetical protein
LLACQQSLSLLERYRYRVYIFISYVEISIVSVILGLQFVFPINLWKLFHDCISVAQIDGAPRIITQSAAKRQVSVILQERATGQNSVVPDKPAEKEHPQLITSDAEQQEPSRLGSAPTAATDTFSYQAGLPESAQTWDCLDSLQEWLNAEEETLIEVQTDGPLLGTGGGQEKPASSFSWTNGTNAWQQSAPLESDEVVRCDSPELTIFDDMKENMALLPVPVLATPYENGCNAISSSSQWRVSKAVSVDLENIAQSEEWGRKVRKCWRHLIITGGYSSQCCGSQYETKSESYGRIRIKKIKFRSGSRHCLKKKLLEKPQINNLKEKKLFFCRTGSITRAMRSSTVF